MWKDAGGGCGVGGGLEGQGMACSVIVEPSNVAWGVVAPSRTEGMEEIWGVWL